MAGETEKKTDNSSLKIDLRTVEDEQLIGFMQDSLKGYYSNKTVNLSDDRKPTEQIVALSEFERKSTEQRFSQSTCLKVSAMAKISGRVDKAYVEFMLRQYDDGEKFGKVDANLEFINYMHPDRFAWAFGGPGDPDAKIFESIYPCKEFSSNNIIFTENINADSLESRVLELANKENQKAEERHIEKFHDPLTLTHDWLPAKAGGIESLKSKMLVEDFDYDKFFDNAFEGMKMLFDMHDDEKADAKKAFSELAKEYILRDELKTLIAFVYPWRNKGLSLVNSSRLCIGPRAIDYGCFYGYPTVFNNILGPDTTIGLSIDNIIKKRKNLREGYVLGYIFDLPKKRLEYGTYCGAILTNLYAASNITNAFGKDSFKSDVSSDDVFRYTINEQIKILDKEDPDRAHDFKEFVDKHQK